MDIEEIEQRIRSLAQQHKNGRISITSVGIQSKELISKELKAKDKEIEYQDKHIKDLNQLSTDRGNELAKLKERVKELEKDFEEYKRNSNIV